jgi:hypothetical protein
LIGIPLAAEKAFSLNGENDGSRQHIATVQERVRILKPGSAKRAGNRLHGSLPIGAEQTMIMRGVCPQKMAVNPLPKSSLGDEENKPT